MKVHLFAVAILATPALALAQAATPNPPGPAVPQKLDGADLAEVRGGADIEATAISTQNLQATNSGNSVTAGTLRSGDVSFGGGALSNFNGVGNFVVNTGANNNLQGAINISIVNLPTSR